MLTRSFVIPAIFTTFFVTTVCSQDTSVNTVLSLAAPISDHMVLQQGKPTSIWGAAAAGSTINIKFADQTIAATADAKGQWSAELEPLAASSEPATMSISSDAGETLAVNDILVGEVWMCSGQSNMFFPLDRIMELPAYQKTLSESNFPNIRFFNTASKTSETPQRDCEGGWKVMSPKTAGEFSAVGYFFGHDEGRRNWIWPSTKGRTLDEFLKYAQESQAHFAKPEIRDALNRNDWNRYIVQCRGDRISIELNGVKVTNLRDATDAEGFIAIQHHGEEGQTYRFRNLFIKELADE